jgi:hypothetical protein
VIARLGGGAARPGPRGGEESGRPLNGSGLPDHGLTVATLDAFTDARGRCDLDELGPAWLE